MSDTIRQEHTQAFTVTEHAEDRAGGRQSLILVSHSEILYWWPVWLVGFIMAGITYFVGENVAIGDNPVERIFQRPLMGGIYVAVLFGVFLFTNVDLRGMAAGALILGVLFVSVLFAWLDLWDPILEFLPHFTIYMNLGFYLVTSILFFVAWALTVFVFDRLSYWRIEAGQITHEHIIGGGEESYDTGGLVFQEFHDDPFKHWGLGFGAGDMKITTKRDSFVLRNVLFANSKVTRAQDLIKRKPD